ILETMPMTEKVEELLHVIGPFYEIVEDKKSGRTSDLTSDLGNVLTSAPNAKTVNGKAESSDSGAESEEEEAQEEVKGAEQSDNDSFTSNNGPFRYYLHGDPNQPLENSAFPEEGSPGNGNIGELQVVAIEGKGEVKHGGEDGRSNSGAPH
ncbi:PREDICTED: acyl-CoA-binding domain-containing protein 5-like, partial [Odobenus rosmarus divergens]|uniref:Acyl-CoA-binding domain-containing protein 5-like n=1 Tax=Odobenus rosmarus divergens TaxID=9708 RepID=A0A9B0HF35_ODORO